MKLIVLLILYLASCYLSEEIFYCKPSDRNAICTLEYIPVCGWYSKDVKCLKYPCAITSGNFCQACSQPEVEYVTEKECPKSKSHYSDVTYPYTCKENDRDADCKSDIDPVIWVDKNCDSNCTHLFTNVCYACKNSQVDYVVKNSAVGLTYAMILSLLYLIFL